MTTYVDKLCELLGIAGAGSDPFAYISGPMTGKRHFNFERFDEVEAKLVEAGRTVVSPARLDGAELRAAAMTIEDGDPKRLPDPYRRFLARDTCVVAMPNCAGVILLEGWHWSTGALWETRVAEFLRKPLWEFQQKGRYFDLVSVANRRERVQELVAAEARNG